MGEETGWISAISTASRVYLFVHPCEKLKLSFCNVLFHPWTIHRSFHLPAEILVHLISLAKQNCGPRNSNMQMCRFQGNT